jgi:hypothetical protein
MEFCPPYCFLLRYGHGRLNVLSLVLLQGDSRQDYQAQQAECLVISAMKLMWIKG